MKGDNNIEYTLPPHAERVMREMRVCFTALKSYLIPKAAMKRYVSNILEVDQFIYDNCPSHFEWNVSDSQTYENLLQSISDSIISQLHIYKLSQDRTQEIMFCLLQRFLRASNLFLESEKERLKSLPIISKFFQSDYQIPMENDIKEMRTYFLFLKSCIDNTPCDTTYMDDMLEIDEFILENLNKSGIEHPLTWTDRYISLKKDDLQNVPFYLLQHHCSYHDSSSTDYVMISLADVMFCLLQRFELISTLLPEFDKVRLKSLPIVSETLGCNNDIAIRTEMLELIDEILEQYPDHRDMEIGEELLKILSNNDKAGILSRPTTFSGELRKRMMNAHTPSGHFVPDGNICERNDLVNARSTLLTPNILLFLEKSKRLPKINAGAEISQINTQSQEGYRSKLRSSTLNQSRSQRY